VIVEFLEGDPDRPIITGRVYNDVATVPYALPDNQTRTTIKSKSTPNADGFNEIRLEDKAGEEEFFLHAQKDMNIVVLNNQTTKVKTDRTITVEEGNDGLTVSKGNRSVQISQGNESTTIAQGNRTVEVSSGKSSLTAGQEITLTVGGNSIKIDASSITLTVGASSMKLDASGVTVNGTQIKLSATAQLEATSSGMTTVKGATVMIN
jgi:type VI secretion system secreted protein VgrG